MLSRRTLVMFGEEDRKVAPGPAAAKLAHYPGIALDTVPHWGHRLPFLEPERTADTLSSWLRGAGSTGADSRSDRGAQDGQESRSTKETS